MSNTASFTLRARYVFPVDAPPVADGFVTISGERIVAVGQMVACRSAKGRFFAERKTTDLGNVAIVPGLVNAHTHLEFSDLASPLGSPGMLFPDWIRSVIANRRSRPANAAAAIAAGLRECVAAGTTALGEIATSGWSPRAFDNCPLEATVFLELIGLSLDRATPRLAEAAEHLQQPGGPNLRRSISPHAPYTVRQSLFKDAVGLSWTYQRPLAFHLAESREELELLRTARGPFRELLEDLGIWDANAIRLNTRPLDYLRWLDRASSALIIHGNYLDAEERQFLASRRHLSLVYCPRTHAWFQHDRYPLPELLAAGVQVALGTDSRASNPDLSILAEMRHVAHEFSELPAPRILELGTLSGARALDASGEYGSLTSGKLANLAIVALPNHDPRDAHELLFDSSETVVGTLYRGRWVSDAGDSCK